MDLYQSFKKLLFSKDDLLKEALQYESFYYSTFGDLIVNIFTQKVEIVKLKKMIAYCQKQRNYHLPINSHDLQQFSQAVDKQYENDLTSLLEFIKDSKPTGTLTEEELNEIKALYRQLSKLIHPDLNPEVYKNSTIQELWTKLQIAYKTNNLEEVKNLEILILNETKYTHISEPINNLQYKIGLLAKEIEKIKSSYPYLYKYDLINPSIKEEELSAELLDLESYSKSLLLKLDEFMIQTLKS